MTPNYSRETNTTNQTDSQSWKINMISLTGRGKRSKTNLLRCRTELKPLMGFWWVGRVACSVERHWQTVESQRVVRAFVCACKHAAVEQTSVLLGVWCTQFNTFLSEVFSRRQVQNFTNFVKNLKIVEFHDYIWNHYEKCIQISTNMDSFGVETVK